MVPDEPYDESGNIVLLLDANTREGEVDLTAQQGLGFLHYVGEGVWHIWIGLDHLLFLCALLLPSVMILTGRQWSPAPDLRSAFWQVIKLVTLFTLAHSVTLALAALDIVSVPSRWVEAVIALSVLLAALNNGAHRKSK